MLRLLIRNPLRIFSFLHGWLLGKRYVDQTSNTLPILLETPGLGVKIKKHGNAKIIIRGQLVVEKRGATGAMSAQRPTIEVYNDAELIINNKVIIGPGTNIIVGVGGRLIFGEIDGEKTAFSYGCKIVANKYVQIGSGCLFSWDILIMDTAGHEINGKIDNRPVIIHDHVWLTARVIILKGVEVGAGAIVATAAVVTKSVPDKSLVGGNPARLLSTDVSWKE